MGETSGDSRTGFEFLTPRERECLRLVARHHQSKEIARLLNISKSTVDKHIDRARERIGATDRRAAALALVAHENDLGIEYPPDPNPIPKAPASRSVEPQFNADPEAFRDRFNDRSADFQPSLPGQLDGAGIGPEPAGQPGPVGSDLDHHFGAAAASAVAAAGEAAGADSQRHGMVDRGRSLLFGGDGHELTALQMLTRIALIAIVGSLLLGGVLMGAQEVTLLIQRIVDGVVPPRG
ncbi:helix-turn-helix transcriptional regulator [Caulobacter sp. NIBR1757]|uniref:response regulator transcription factor n=1 Tax=Caulobacter sp. NIBR1757 TaxID=3016000 RepID=UPI0022F11A55|nr:helix-turn-helix transcriptional regulator [Caulobacter sp. NIBR1757]